MRRGFGIGLEFLWPTNAPTFDVRHFGWLGYGGHLPYRWMWTNV